jgi:signal transduction histidine kinase
MMTRDRPRWRPGRLAQSARRCARALRALSRRAVLPRRTVQLRLAAVYATLLLVSGACLLTITYFLVDQNTTPPVMISTRGAAGKVGGAVISGSGGRAASAGGESCLVARGTTTPSAGQLAQCVTYLAAANAAARGSYLGTLLGDSAIALGAMTVAAVGIGWLTAGRVLRPLRTITWTARSISASSLHRRLALAGPDDELKELGDTIDGLLARLEAAFDAQRQFVANASHELRTPLARQRTLVEVALAQPDQTVDGLRATCERVVAAGEQQERLIEALLTLARSQRGLDRWEQVDLAAVTSEAVQARQHDAAGQQLRMQTSGGSDRVLALGDARLAERLVANLIDNAIRHNVPGGWVSVHVDTATGQARVRVTNSGPVIPPTEVARLFAPFQRLGASRGVGGCAPGSGVGTGRAGGREDWRDGHGLGLSIVSAIAGAHGADLRADALPNGGLAVQLRFPPVPVAQSAPEPQRRQPAGPHPPGRALAATGPSRPDRDCGRRGPDASAPSRPPLEWPRPAGFPSAGSPQLPPDEAQRSHSATRALIRSGRSRCRKWPTPSMTSTLDPAGRNWAARAVVATPRQPSAAPCR